MPQQGSNSGVVAGQHRGRYRQGGRACGEVALVVGWFWFVGDGGEDDERDGGCGSGEELKGVEEVVEALVGLGAAQGEDEAVDGDLW
jgi:hypothetical protein